MKYKKIPKKYIKVCLDRLTRFKPVYEKYERVFRDIINQFLISKPNQGNEGEFDLINAAVEIFNSSLQADNGEDKNGGFISKLLIKEELETFFVDEREMNFLNSGIDFDRAVKYIEGEEGLPLNLKRLTVLSGCKNADSESLRKQKGLLYPIKKVVLVEGATEEILLSKFAAKCGYDFNKEGVYVLGAGGKNQVARKYYKMVDDIKLPVFILLDNDAAETKELIVSKLSKKDKIYLIKEGEFEDILSKNLIINAINFNFSNNLHTCADDFNPDLKMTKNLHILFKNKGFGEYKKADFAKMVKNYLDTAKVSDNEITQSIREIIDEIRLLNS